MNRSYRITPVYTGDVSGVCSALYELGGMTVMHDPSGCNSTYNTHDETRWYDQDSLIFLSGLKHRDAVMGNDDRLIEAVLQAADELKPKFITLCNSPIPYINGTDFHAIGRIIEKKATIPVLIVPTNGMHDYTIGVGEALKQVAMRLVPGDSVGGTKSSIYQEKYESASLIKQSGADVYGSKYKQANEKSVCPDEQKVIPRSLNILGMTPLDFSAKSSVESLNNIIEEHGWQVISNWAMDTSLEECQQAGRAKMNLVVSSVGLAAAKVLEKRFGTPYVVGCPMGQFAQYVFAALEKGQTSVAYTNIRNHNINISKRDNGIINNNICSSNENTSVSRNDNRYNDFFEESLNIDQGTAHSSDAGRITEGIISAGELDENRKLILIGEPVTMCSLAAAIELEQGIPVQVLCPLENHKGLLRSNGIPVHGEEDMEKLLQTAKRVMADPLYKPLCAPDTEFIPLPHQAFSGRCFRKQYKNLFEFTL